MKTRMKVLLTGSLLLNVMLIGVIGGQVYKRWAAHPWHEVKKEFSPETRNLVGRTFQGAFREIRPLGAKARKTRAEILKIFTAENFDEEAYDQATEEILETRGQMARLKIQATKDLAKQLSVEERQKMADRMARMVGGGFERKVRRDRKPRMVKPIKKPEEIE